MSREKYEKCLKILGLQAGVELKEIKSAYKKLVLKHHPDRQTDPVAQKSANEKLKKINEAREFLLENYKYYGNSSTSQKTKSTSSKSTSSKSSSYNKKSSSTKTKKKKTSTKSSKTTPTKKPKGGIKQTLYNYRESEKIDLKILVKPIVIFFVIVIFVSINSSIENYNANNDIQQNEVSSEETEDYDNNYEKSEYTETTLNENKNEIIEQNSYADNNISEKSDLTNTNITPPKRELSQSERIANFENEMARAFDDFISKHGQYYGYAHLKDRTFTYNLSSYLNNNLYKSEYISGDFKERYEGMSLGREFESFMMGLPISFRDDYKTNFELRYKMQLTHTPNGTTIKLLNVWHYLEGD